MDRPDRRRLRGRLYRLADQALAHAQLTPSQATRSDVGDGLWLLVTPEVPTMRLLHPLASHLARGAARSNQHTPAAERMRLRVVVQREQKLEAAGHRVDMRFGAAGLAREAFRQGLIGEETARTIDGLAILRNLEPVKKLCTGGMIGARDRALTPRSAGRDHRRMRLLVLGGTWFLGRVLVNDALRRGFEVTAFNRGKSGADVPGVEVVRGDRGNRDDLKRLVANRDWDAVIDTGGYIPQDVGRVARALDGRTSGYVFVSTVSVYTGWPDEPLTEDSAVYDCAPDADGGKQRDYGWYAYGIYKAGSERAVRQVFGDAALVVRPGVILGPYEYVGRLPWWLGRAARGGRMLAPGDPDRTIQPIDVRDVAAFILDCLADKTAGVFNLSAPQGAATMGEFIGACVEVTGADAGPVWVSDAFLVDQGIRQWTELPLWRTSVGAWAVDPGRAMAAGLVCRPLRDTVADTWAWLRAGNVPVAHPRQGEHGITPDRERRLLALWDRLRA